MDSSSSPYLLIYLNPASRHCQIKVYNFSVHLVHPNCRSRKARHCKDDRTNEARTDGSSFSGGANFADSFIPAQSSAASAAGSSTWAAGWAENIKSPPI